MSMMLCVLCAVLLLPILASGYFGEDGATVKLDALFALFSSFAADWCSVAAELERNRVAVEKAAKAAADKQKRDRELQEKRRASSSISGAASSNAAALPVPPPPPPQHAVSAALAAVGAHGSAGNGVAGAAGNSGTSMVDAVMHTLNNADELLRAMRQRRAYNDRTLTAANATLSKHQRNSSLNKRNQIMNNIIAQQQKMAQQGSAGQPAA